MSLLSPEFRNPDPIDLLYRPFLHCVILLFGLGNGSQKRVLAT